MTQEDKELLLKDLSARLPYHVYLKIWLKDGTIEEGFLDLEHNYADVLQDAFYYNKIKDIKPYLRPISSMTEEEKKDLLIHVLGKEKDCKYFQVLSDGSIDSMDAKQQELECFNFRWVNFDSETTSAYIDFCNKNHIDYRNLIGKNLALDATNLNIY